MRVLKNQWVYSRTHSSCGSEHSTMDRGGAREDPPLPEDPLTENGYQTRQPHSSEVRSLIAHLILCKQS